MEEIQLVSKNSFMLSLRELVLKLTGFITFPIIARSIGVSVLGVLGAVQSFTGILFLVADLGLNKSLIKEVAQTKKDVDILFSNAVVLKIISMSGAVIVGVMVVSLSGLDEFSRRLTLLVLGLSFLVGIYELIKSMFSAYERMEYLPLIDGLAKISTLLAVILIFLVFKRTIIELQICSILITLGIIVLSLKLFTKKIRRVQFKPNIKMLSGLLKVSIPFMMVGLFAQTFGAVDSLMLAAMLGKDAVGYYQIAYKFIVFLQFIPATISAALFPTLSRLYVEDSQKFEYGLKRCIKYLLLSSIPIAVSLNFMAPGLISIFFGAEYMRSVILLKLLTWSLILMFVTFPIGVSLGVSGNQKFNVIAFIYGSSGNIIMNYLFIDFWGINGVAISTLLTTCIVFISLVYFFKKVFNTISLLERSTYYIWRPLLLFWLFRYFVPVEGFTNLLIFNAIFFTGSLALKIIDREDWLIIGKVLRAT